MTKKIKSEFYDYNRLGDLLFIFHKNHKTYLNNALAQYDLNLIQVLCMLRVYNEENLNQKDLSDSLYITKGAITKAIKKLESNGIIIREQSSTDKRHNILQLSEKGKNLIPILEEINNEWEKKMGLDKLDDDFFKTFIDLAFKSAELNEWE
ncbi:MAG: MarR family transcriptional regulator [Methanobrevibacter ruminantium]|uniref:MarR family winged helix-turn-helix transcriptional regulator n=1 Tax=Methanobrevibacter ruminantium TaxID=83816 RepID=UPI0026EF7C0F|nr:MarR family transcriptional regulator [Methanobrevibacter ruminantium]MDD6049128.1 MarR family transcriptional regulator [Methanobrevibacter ruminantium]